VVPNTASYTASFSGPSLSPHGVNRSTLLTETRSMPNELTGTQTRGNAGLVDVLDRVLDKGLVVAGDIKVSIADVELLTIRIRLLICSIDKAAEIGLDWWKYDRNLSPGREPMLQENLELREQMRALERRLATLTRPSNRRGRAIVAPRSNTR
jgi:hypothetical protein